MLLALADPAMKHVEGVCPAPRLAAVGDRTVESPHLGQRRRVLGGAVAEVLEEPAMGGVEGRRVRGEKGAGVVRADHRMHVERVGRLVVREQGRVDEVLTGPVPLLLVIHPRHHAAGADAVQFGERRRAVEQAEREEDLSPRTVEETIVGGEEPLERSLLGELRGLYTCPVEVALPDLADESAEYCQGERMPLQVIDLLFESGIGAANAGIAKGRDSRRTVEPAQLDALESVAIESVELGERRPRRDHAQAVHSADELLDQVLERTVTEFTTRSVLTGLEPVEHQESATRTDPPRELLGPPERIVLPDGGQTAEEDEGATEELIRRDDRAGFGALGVERPPEHAFGTCVLRSEVGEPSANELRLAATTEANDGDHPDLFFFPAASQHLLLGVTTEGPSVSRRQGSDRDLEVPGRRLREQEGRQDIMMGARLACGRDQPIECAMATCPLNELMHGRLEVRGRGDSLESDQERRPDEPIELVPRECIGERLAKLLDFHRG